MDTRQRMLLIALLLVFGLAGCGGSDSGSNTTDFTGFVKDRLASNSDTSEPTSVNDRDFEFSDLENPGAYDDQF